MSVQPRQTSEQAQTTAGNPGTPGTLRRTITRWHRRLGIASALVVIMLAVTGIALNHIDALFDSNETVQSDWLLDWYNFPTPDSVTTFRTTQLGINIVWGEGLGLLNGKAKLVDQNFLIAALEHDSLLYLFTESQLHLFTQDTELVESISLSALGRLKRVQATASPEILWLDSELGQGWFDLNTLGSTQPASDPDRGTDLSTLLGSADANSEPAKQIRRNLLHKSRVLQDLHSGRLFGPLGVWIVDLFALIFMLLALSGCYMWYRKGRKSGR